MKKSVVLGAALGLAALTGLGWAGVATAQDRYRNDGQYRNDNREWQDRGYGNRAADFTGTWRLDERRNRQGWNRGWGFGTTQLPAVIHIERERRELRVENARGRLLRAIDLRGGEARDGRIQVVSTGAGGARVVETFTIRGRELVVHTTVQGRRGTQQFTSVYDRA